MGVIFGSIFFRFVGAQMVYSSNLSVTPETNGSQSEAFGTENCSTRTQHRRHVRSHGLADK